MIWWVMVIVWGIVIVSLSLGFYVLGIQAWKDALRLRRDAEIAREDLAQCIEALCDIRSIDVPEFRCKDCKGPQQETAWQATKRLSQAIVRATLVLREISTPVECEFCDGDKVIPCSACFGGNTRDGEYCRVCDGTGCVPCEDCASGDGQ